MGKSQARRIWEILLKVGLQYTPQHQMITSANYKRMGYGLCVHTCMHTHYVEGKGWGGDRKRDREFLASKRSSFATTPADVPGPWPNSWFLLKQSLSTSLKKVASSKTGLGSPLQGEKGHTEKKKKKKTDRGWGICRKKRAQERKQRNRSQEESAEFRIRASGEMLLTKITVIRIILTGPICVLRVREMRVMQAPGVWGLIREQKDAKKQSKCLLPYRPRG